MKNKFYLLSLLLGLLFMTYSCSDDEPGLSVDLPGGEVVHLGAEIGADYKLSFHASQNWVTSINVDWLKVEPGSGDAGDYTLTLSVVKPNDSGDVRTATLTVISGEEPLRIPVTQDEYIRVSDPELTVQAGGGNIDLRFYTPLQREEFGVFIELSCDWLTSPPKTRAAGGGEEQEWVVSLYALPNESTHSRSTTVYFGKIIDGEQILNENNLLATVTIMQEGLITGESTDYSQDGKVRVMQRHSAGQGIPLVLVGDGFMDKEIANGYYDQVMDGTVDLLFTEEPIRSLRGYFDIYAVTAVSATNVFNEELKTAMQCWMEGGNSTLAQGNDSLVQNYVKKVEGIDVDMSQIVVVLNSDFYAGTNNNYWYGENEPLVMAISYCPTINGLGSEDFRRVLVHETVGHGIGKLHDEYSYEGNGAIPMDVKLLLQQQQRDFDWWLNVDFTDDWNAVLWSDFLIDPRYDGQGLGVFEGACAYWSGAYRSTEESMMRNNILGFNAPSRRAIYQKVIERGEGRTPSLEEFISFDQRTYVPQTRAAGETPSRPFARPQVKRLERR